MILIVNRGAVEEIVQALRDNVKAMRDGNAERVKTNELLERLIEIGDEPDDPEAQARIDALAENLRKSNDELAADVAAKDNPTT